jgi:hypothetical protein
MKIYASVWLEVTGGGVPQCQRGVVSCARQEHDVVKVSFGRHIEMREFFWTYLLLPI